MRGLAAKSDLARISLEVRDDTAPPAGHDRAYQGDGDVSVPLNTEFRIQFSQDLASCYFCVGGPDISQPVAR